MKTMLALTALTALAAALCVAPATAQTPADGGGTQTVATADLDLRTDRGRSALDRRILTAVRTACGTPSSADLEGRNDARRCRAETMAQVAAQRDRAIAAAPGSTATALASQR